MKKDRAMCRRPEDNRVENKVIENCSVVIFPSVDYQTQSELQKNIDMYENVVQSANENEYLDSEDRTGKGVGEGVLNHLQRYEVSLDQLQIAMTDGTSKMTGGKGGSIATWNSSNPPYCKNLLSIFLNITMVKLRVLMPSLALLVNACKVMSGKKKLLSLRSWITLSLVTPLKTYQKKF